MATNNLANNQKVPYRVLTNALQHHTLSHAYLFVGERGTHKKEMAMYLAQSIVCEQGDHACGTCASCRRVAQFQYGDLLYFDGHQGSIKKDDILKIQEQFNKTALEKKGQKIFILDYIENATIDALNSLLKFLEEPSNDVTAILTTQSLDRILPTIVSRCQVIKFKKNNPKNVFEEAKALCERELDAFLLAQQINNAQEIQMICESDEYQSAVYLFEQTLPYYGKDYEQILYILQSEGFSKKKTSDKDVIRYYLGMLKSVLKYKLDHQESGVPSFQQYLQRLPFTKEETMKLLLLVLESEDRIHRSTNIALAIDSLVYQMKEGNKNGK